MASFNRKQIVFIAFITDKKLEKNSQLKDAYYFFTGEREPYGSSIGLHNLSQTSAQISWLFNPNDVKTMLTVDPPNIPSITFLKGETSATLTQLKQGTFYNVHIFPMIPEDMGSFFGFGDPLTISFETTLEDPEIEILHVHQYSVSGTFSVVGRFQHAEILLVGVYKEPNLLFFGENLEWSFVNLIPASSYSVLLRMYTAHQRVYHDTAEFETKPNTPVLKDQTVNDVDNSVEIILEIPEKVSYLEYKITCNGDNETLYGPFQYKPRFEFSTRSEDLGCHLEARSLYKSVHSDWLLFVIGLSLVENLEVTKNTNVKFFFQWKIRTGKLSHVLISYETVSLGLQETVCHAGSLNCSVEAKDLPGVYLNFSVTGYLHNYTGLTRNSVVAFPPYLHNFLAPQYGNAEVTPSTVDIEFYFFGRYDVIEVRSDPFVDAFNFDESKLK